MAKNVGKMVTDNGRYGGGAGGPETRHHNEAADTARFHEATEGAIVKTANHGDMPERLPQAQANTMAGGRGVMTGPQPGRDKAQKGF